MDLLHFKEPPCPKKHKSVPEPPQDERRLQQKKVHAATLLKNAGAAGSANGAAGDVAGAERSDIPWMRQLAL